MIKPSEKLKKEIFRFLQVGGVGVIIDWSSYTLLQYMGLLDPSWSKRASFVLGSIWAYFMNKHYTFENKHGRRREPFLFVAVYLSGLLFNSLTHDFVLHITEIKWLSLFMATGVSTCTNFIGNKLIVFRKKKEA